MGVVYKAIDTRLGDLQGAPVKIAERPNKLPQLLQFGKCGSLPI